MTKTFQELYPHGRHSKASYDSIWKRIGRVLYDAANGFLEDDCFAKASALTYYSLLSIVPVLAVLFGIAKGFGFEQALETEIQQQFYDQKELLDKLIEFAYSWLENVRGGVIAGIGTIALLWSVLGLLNNIESALNAIWKTPTSRPYARKLTDYLATVVICPLFFVTSSSINVYLSTQLTQNHSNVIVEAVSPFLLYVLKLFPFFLSWTLFTFIYLFIPYTKVNFRSALIAGVIAGTIFQLWQWLYIKFQIYATSYGAIYGSFAALPLFLIWLQISWIILLAGAELAYEVENDLFIPQRNLIPISSKAAALLITYRCIEAFAQNKPPKTDLALGRELGISLNHLHILLEALQKERILSAISYGGSTIGYQPAQPIENITYATVCDAIDKNNDLNASVQESEALEKIQRYMRETKATLENEKNNTLLYNDEE